jgi:hypothetical protein
LISFKLWKWPIQSHVISWLRYDWLILSCWNLMSIICVGEGEWQMVELIVKSWSSRLMYEVYLVLVLKISVNVGLLIVKQEILTNDWLYWVDWMQWNWIADDQDLNDFFYRLRAMFIMEWLIQCSNVKRLIYDFFHHNNKQVHEIIVKGRRWKKELLIPVLFTYYRRPKAA